jgi:hypothetical protein
VASSLYFSFTNQYSLGGGLRFQKCWCLGTSYLCVTLVSNLIFLAFQELVSLRVGCVTTWSRGSHHLVSELGSINQVISFWNFHFLLFPQKKFLSIQFLLLLIFAAYQKKKIVISFGFWPKYISGIKKKRKKKVVQKGIYLFLPQKTKKMKIVIKFRFMIVIIIFFLV